MTVDTVLLATRLAKIREEMRHLRRLQSLPREEFLTSPIQQHAAERELHAVLRESGIVDPDLGRRLEDMASFRNRLVHGYLDVDPGRVLEVALTELGDVEAFVATVVRRYLPESADR